MRRARSAGILRLLALLAVVASLLVLVEAPLNHAMSGARPGASDPTIPVEEEQRTEAVAGTHHARLAARTRHHAVYQESIAPAPGMAPRHQLRPPAHSTSPHRGFAGAPLPLRC